MLKTLEQIYTDYDAAAAEARRKAPVWASILGSGSSAQKHPCHMAFYESVEKWIGEFVQTQPQSSAAFAVAVFLLEEPTRYKQGDGYWFMYACVGLIRALVPYIHKEDCAQLAERMNALYKKRDRMPVQEEAYKMLCKKAKGK